MLEYIKEIRKLQKNKRSIQVPADENDERYFNMMMAGIEQDIQNNDYAVLLQGYQTYFKDEKRFQAKILRTKQDVYYRGRIGKITLKGAEDDWNREFTMPYYGGQMQAAPKLCTKGGRFNREGFSYLYLASDIKTCLAEIHAQVGQECTVASFTCKRDIKLMNLVDNRKGDDEIKLWYKIMTQPIYDAVKYRYLVTQFLADVFRENYPDGIYFKSSQAKGKNIVCFDPSLFALQEHSEKIYLAERISYTCHRVSDSADEFAAKKRSYDINSLNLNEERQKEKEFQYLKELIQSRTRDDL